MTIFPSWRATQTPGNSKMITELDHIRNLFLERNEMVPYSGIFWDLVCYPINSKHLYEVNKREFIQLLCHLETLLKSAIPEYADDLNELVSESQPPVHVSFLSSSGVNFLARNNGDRVALDAFRGKYVLVCCFHVPVLWETWNFQALINVCEELYSTRPDFEMVMVARMNKLADTKAVFDHFFSGFPELCVAVPFEDNQQRDYICNVLGLGSYSLECIECRFFDTDGNVLPFSQDRILDSYGAEAFPFTEEIMDDIDDILLHGELKKLLKPNIDVGAESVDVIVSQFNPSPASDSKLLCDVINDKHVGLYMCSDGKLIPQLRELHDQCLEKHREFEIVVLYCPRVEKVDPKLHKEQIDKLLQKHNVRSWWCLPFNNSVSMRFENMTRSHDAGKYYVKCFEKLIIVGVDGKILDMYGAEVINSGIDAFPFTREDGIANQVRRAHEIRLESLFTEAVYRGNDESKTSITVEQLLQGRKEIIIYMAPLHRLEPCELEVFVKSYDEKKLTYRDEFEVVFFDNLWKSDEDSQAERVIHAMPWYVHPVNGTHSPSILELINCFGDVAMFGFGVDDGKLCSIKHLGWFDEEICLGETLHQDVGRLLYYSGYKVDI